MFAEARARATLAWSRAPTLRAWARTRTPATEAPSNVDGEGTESEIYAF
jgi:hypothetical protein